MPFYAGRTLVVSTLLSLYTLPVFFTILLFLFYTVYISRQIIEAVRIPNFFPSTKWENKADSFVI